MLDTSLLPLHLWVFNQLLILDGSYVKETCGKGVNCDHICDKHGGPKTKCLAFFYGDNPDDQAKQHCERAIHNSDYCHPGYYFYMLGRLV